ncbi:hypothetical protein D9M68_553260 [compost metagenome]
MAGRKFTACNGYTYCSLITHLWVQKKLLLISPYAKRNRFSGICFQCAGKFIHEANRFSIYGKYAVTGLYTCHQSRCRFFNHLLLYAQKGFNFCQQACRFFICCRIIYRRNTLGNYPGLYKLLNTMLTDAVQYGFRHR